MRERSRRSYWDYYVDGQRLADELRVGDFIPPIGWLGGEAEQRFLAMLLRKADGDLPGGRVPLFVCAECADYGCGVVSCIVERTEDGIVWRDFATQNDYSEDIRFDEFGARYRYTFDPSQYHGVFVGHYELATRGG